MSQINGIDISFAQGQVDLGALMNRWGAQFVIIRAGYGGGGVDEQFARNRDQARSLNVLRQFYFYAYPGRSSGAQQARDFHAIVGDLQAGESISLDMEDDPRFGRNLVASDVAWAKEFLDTCKDLFGVKPLIYMNSNVKSRFDWSPVAKADYGLWLANYGLNDGTPHSQPDAAPWPFWAIWQYSSQPIDKDIFSGDAKAFQAYGKGGSAPAPSPAPAPAPVPTPPPSNQFTVNSPIPGYVNAGDAAARRSSNSTVPAGTYAIFNQSQGMVNVTRQAGQPGWWINPGDNGGAPAPQPTSYTVVGGDTLGKISARPGNASVDQIVAWNKPKYPSMTRDYIQAGWNIRVR